MNWIWILNTGIYVITFLGSIIELIITSVNIGTKYLMSNDFLNGLCIILSILLMVGSIFWLKYNWVSQTTTFLKLKTKAKILDIFALSYTIIFYIIATYLTYILFGIDLKPSLTPFFNGILWFGASLGILKVISFILNIVFMTNQARIGKNNTYYWWPNLVYSYWLDKALFSLRTEVDTISYSDVIINNTKLLDSKPNLTRAYYHFFKFKNLTKWLTQNLILVLFLAIASSVAMSSASIYYWVHASEPSAVAIAFIAVIWVILNFIGSVYIIFMSVNQFQLMKLDNETKIVNYYDGIALKFVNYKAKEQDLIFWLSILRKYLLYYKPFITHTTKQTVEINYGKFIGTYYWEYSVKSNVFNQNTLTLKITKTNI